MFVVVFKLFCLLCSIFEDLVCWQPLLWIVLRMLFCDDSEVVGSRQCACSCVFSQSKCLLATFCSMKFSFEQQCQLWRLFPVHVNKNGGGAMPATATTPSTCIVDEEVVTVLLMTGNNSKSEKKYEDFAGECKESLAIGNGTKTMRSQHCHQSRISWRTLVKKIESK